jgi:hypothetical protein
VDQRRTQPRQRVERRRPFQLEGAPELDARDEAALDAIRRQLDEEFAAAEATLEVSNYPEDRDRPGARPEAEARRRPRPSSGHVEARLLPEPEARSRPAANGGERRAHAPLEREVRPRPAPDVEVRTRPTPSSDPREHTRPAWTRPGRFGDERVVHRPSRPVREPVDRSGPRFPPHWRERETEAPPPPEARPRRGVFVTIGLAAGLAGGVVGALATVLLLAGGRPDTLHASWDRVVTAARDSRLVEMAIVAKDRALSPDAGHTDNGAAARPDARPPVVPPSSAPRRGPVTTAEIPGPLERSPGGQRPESTELRSLVAAGREAYVRKDYATAERLFAEAVERSLADGLLRYHHAIALMGLGRFTEARVELRNALRLGVEPMVADEAQRALTQLSGGRRR